MNPQLAADLGTPAISSAVFCFAAGIATGWNGPAMGAGTVMGWMAGTWSRRAAPNPAGNLLRRFEMAAQRPQETTIILPQQPDGFTPRVSSAISPEQWQAVARVVVERSATNLTQTIIHRALPSLVQDEYRDLHSQMVGLLSPRPIGVVNKKDNGHNEITDPVGWLFFRSLYAGKLGPLYRYGLHHSPRSREIPKSGGFPQHARPPRADFDPEGGWNAV